MDTLWKRTKRPAIAKSNKNEDPFDESFDGKLLI
jgi:hypothetical protein